MKKKIYYHDTDCGGVVYYANYLKFIEEARTEFFSDKGLSIKELAREGTMFVVARQEVDYKLPAFYGDILDVGAVISNISAASIDFDHEIKKDNQIVAKAKTIMVCVGKTLRAKSIPEEIRKKIS